jgi:hypothetical protein
LPLDLAGTADVEGDEFHGLFPEFSHELTLIYTNYWY